MNVFLFCFNYFFNHFVFIPAEKLFVQLMEAKLFWQIHWYHGVNVNLKKNDLEKTFLFDFFINFLRGFAMMLKCAQNISDGVK